MPVHQQHQHKSPMARHAELSAVPEESDAEHQSEDVASLRAPSAPADSGGGPAASLSPQNARVLETHGLSQAPPDATGCQSMGTAAAAPEQHRTAAPSSPLGRASDDRAADVEVLAESPCVPVRRQASPASSSDLQLEPVLGAAATTACQGDVAESSRAQPAAHGGAAVPAGTAPPKQRPAHVTESSRAQPAPCPAAAAVPMQRPAALEPAGVAADSDYEPEDEQLEDEEPQWEPEPAPRQPAGFVPVSLQLLSAIKAVAPSLRRSAASEPNSRSPFLQCQGALLPRLERIESSLCCTVGGQRQGQWRRRRLLRPPRSWKSSRRRRRGSAPARRRRL